MQLSRLLLARLQQRGVRTQEPQHVGDSTGQRFSHGRAQDCCETIEPPRFDAHDIDLPGHLVRLHSGRDLQQLRNSHAVHAHGRLRDLFQIRTLQQEAGSRRLAGHGGVHDDEVLVTLEQVEHVEADGTAKLDAHVRWQDQSCEHAAHANSDSIVSGELVSDAQHNGRHAPTVGRLATEGQGRHSNCRDRALTFGGLRPRSGAVHELSIAQSILDTVNQQAALNSAARVVSIHLRIGELTAIVHDALTFSFEIVAQGTCAQGAVLEIEQVPWQIRCAGCALEFHVQGANLSCPNCQHMGGETITGRELQIVEMNVE